MNLADDDRLDSWKEIATFLKRGIRTVQRWERTEGLPVHRHQHNKLGSVYALKSEVSAWWSSRQRELERGTGEQKHLRTNSEEGRRSRLLVLPFVNLSGDAQQDYLSEGLTEEMITRLARLQPDRLGVIARSTTMSYKATPKRVDQIAAELSLDYIVEGSVRRARDHVRITAQLIQARDHTHLWAQTYDRDLRDVLALQGDVASAIAREIHVALAPRHRAELDGVRTVNPEAYEAYLKGRYLLNRMTPAALEQSIRCFGRAVERDPTYALAYAGISHAYGLLAIAPFDALAPHEAMPKAASAARKALELDGSLPEAHAALGLVLHHYEWNWRNAEEAYQRALELNPDYAGACLRYAWLLLALSRVDTALDVVQRAQKISAEIDPHLLVIIRATRAAAFYFAREYDRAIAECQDALELDANYFLLHYLLGRALARKGKHSEAISRLTRTKRAWGEVPLMDMGVGLAHVVSGRKAQAVAVLGRLKKLMKRRYVPPTYIGILYAGLRDHAAAFEWLEKAYEERADGLTLLNVEPMVDVLRGDARFKDLVRRVGLIPTR